MHFSAKYFRELIALVVLVVLLVSCSGGSGGSGGGGGTSGGGGGGQGSLSAEVAYVSVTTSAGDGQIQAFKFDPNSGSLTFSPIGTFSGPPSSQELKLDPSGKYIYASGYYPASVYSYSLNKPDGSLQPVSGSPFPAPDVHANGQAIEVTPDGRFLFLTDGINDIVTYTITAGVLTVSGPTYTNASAPFEMAANSGSNLLYVSDQNGPQFSVYSIDSTSGQLQPIPGAPFNFHDNTEPYSFAIHPNGKFAYSALMNGYTFNGTVTPAIEGMSIDPSTGALSLLSGYPFQAKYSVLQHLAFADSGKYLYVGAASGGAVEAFNVDGNTGVLNEVQGSPYPGGDARFLAVDPSGNFLFVTCASSGLLELYQIDHATGKLSNMAGITFASGQRPNGLVVARLN